MSQGLDRKGSGSDSKGEREKLGEGALHFKAAETPGISDKQGCFLTSHACSRAVRKATATIFRNRRKGTGTQRDRGKSGRC